jgi:hypothetical protein
MRSLSSFVAVAAVACVALLSAYASASEELSQPISYEASHSRERLMGPDKCRPEQEAWAALGYPRHEAFVYNGNRNQEVVYCVWP